MNSALQFIKHQRQQGAGSTQTNVYKLADDGKPHIVRVVPMSGSVWSFQVLQHWAINPQSQNGQQRPFICLSDQPVALVPKEGQVALPTYGKNCVFCEQKAKYQLELEGTEGDEAKKLGRKIFKLGHAESQLIYLIDREDIDSGMKRMFAMKQQYDVIFNAYINFLAKSTGCGSKEDFYEKISDEAFGESIPDVWDFVNGHDLILTKVKDDKGRLKFTASIVEEASPLGTDAQIARWTTVIEDPVKVIKDDIVSNIDFYNQALELLELDIERTAKRDRTNLQSRRVEEDDSLPLPTPPRKAAAQQPQKAAAEPDEEGGEPTFVDPDEEAFTTPPSTGKKLSPEEAKERLRALAAEEE